MSVRTIALACAVAASFALPAHAEEGLGVNTQFAGEVISASEQLVPGERRAPGAEQAAGQCTYTGQTTLSGRMQFQFAGEAAGTSTSQSQPELTVIKCTMVSPAQGLPGEQPTLTSSPGEIAFPGGAAATVGTVASWPVRPVVVCVDGYVIFGPTPVVTKTIIHACVSSTL